MTLAGTAWHARFAADLAALIDPGARVGIAVSGGPDSLALLLLANAARPGMIEAATVDHRLRERSMAEATAVERLCTSLHIPHATLTARWPEPPTANIQSRAREERYALLAGWASARGLAAIATAHHADDQAETLLMRLARGSGVTGLAAVRPISRLSRESGNPATVIRPLLGWRKAELTAIVANAGLKPVDDSANRDPRHDRTRTRQWLAQPGAPDALRLATTASNLREADEALDWSLDRLIAERLTERGGAIEIDPADLPREYQRRLLLAAFTRLGAAPPRGAGLTAALDRLLAGETTTLGGLKLEGGARWRVGAAPPRRSA